MPLRQRLSTVLQIGAVSVMSVLVLGGLLLAVLGYRPMVERSGSMVPKLQIGDIVIAHWEHVDQVRPGQIITFAADIGRPQLITHRVQRVIVGRDSVHVITKGDANAEPDDEWTVSRNTLVGHYDWRIPKIGRALVWLGEAPIRRTLIAVTIALLALAVAVGILRRRRPHAGQLAINGP